MTVTTFGRRAAARLTAIVVFIALAAFSAAHEGGEPHTQDEGHRADVFTTRQSQQQLALPKGDDVFHFIVYGDRTSGVPEGLKYLRQAVVDTNLLDPDLVMTVGDLIQGYNRTPEWLREKDEYLEIMAKLRMPWYPVAGNHDVYWQQNDPRKPFRQHEANYEKHFGPLWYSFKHKNAGFVVLFSDEGDPQTGDKSFNEARAQQMSAEQLDFLSQALADCKGMDHVFVFLHHPRWIGGGYTGSNWDEVHRRLVEAGNVSAVFAGHIHHMRYDGPRDGIEYFTLATTGGNLSADFPDAGFLHHFNVITVREGSFQVATVPVGAVIDPKRFTAEFVDDLQLARSACEPTGTPAPLPISVSRDIRGEFEVAFRNPAKHPVELVVELADADQAWRLTPDHQHLLLRPEEQKTLTFRLEREAVEDWSKFEAPAMNVTGSYLTEQARFKLPLYEARVPMRLAEQDVEAAGEDRSAAFDEGECIRLDPESFEMPQGPFTVEAWVRPEGEKEAQSVIAKTQRSEFAIGLRDGTPHFDVQIASADGKRYATARAIDPLPQDRWTHLAGTFDGDRVRLFVDGRMVADQEAEGERVTNRLSMYFAADPGNDNEPGRFFIGRLDDVRLSRGVRYRQDFSPAKRLATDGETLALFSMDRAYGPFVVDSSGRRVLARVIGDVEFVPSER